MDIVERLRCVRRNGAWGLAKPRALHAHPVCQEAAAEIERLRAELAARGGEIADWLRSEIAYELARNSDHGDLIELADEIERGAYRKQKTV